MEIIPSFSPSNCKREASTWMLEDSNSGIKFLLHVCFRSLSSDVGVGFLKAADLSRCDTRQSPRLVGRYTCRSLAARRVGAWLGAPGSQTCSNGVQMEF